MSHSSDSQMLSVGSKSFVPAVPLNNNKLSLMNNRTSFSTQEMESPKPKIKPERISLMTTQDKDKLKRFSAVDNVPRRRVGS